MALWEPFAEVMAEMNIVCWELSKPRQSLDPLLKEAPRPLFNPSYDRIGMWIVWSRDVILVAHVYIWNTLSVMWLFFCVSRCLKSGICLGASHAAWSDAPSLSAEVLWQLANRWEPLSGMPYWSKGTLKSSRSFNGKPFSCYAPMAISKRSRSWRHYCMARRRTATFWSLEGCVQGLSPLAFSYFLSLSWP